MGLVLDGEPEPSVPMLGQRDDGSFMLYPGKTHLIASEPEAGKTWLALFFCAQEMKRGNAVCYVDYEDDARSAAQRLSAMGVSDDLIRGLFTYIRPTGRLRTKDRKRLIEFVRDKQISLVIIDGFTEALTTEGKSLVDNQAVAEFWRSLPQPLADAGPAVVLLDHEVKNGQDRGRYPLGAGHKLAAISGAAFKLRVVASAAVGSTGRSRLSVTKDRHAGVRAHDLDGEGLIGELQIIGRSQTSVSVSLSSTPGRAAQQDADTEMADRIVAAIKAAKKPLCSKGAVHALVSGNAQRKSRALNSMIDCGRVAEVQGRFQVMGE